MSPPLIAGILPTALYLIGVFLFCAGLHTGNTLAWQLALATMGVCAAAYGTMYAEWRFAPVVLVTASWMLGACAGLVLLGR